ncbi:hypothetical protein [Microbacterium sulfonylureivorans]|uniref:hypothetical protein n=1 Tax=Microbacterium sulfonylureivorans TaxID=2486854 RepID=UPI000FD6FB5C|nr:hypothetical protein [Microbacterium sulfonylureivorans]
MTLRDLNLTPTKSIAQRIAEKSAAARHDNPSDNNGNPHTDPLPEYEYDDKGQLTRYNPRPSATP